METKDRYQEWLAGAVSVLEQRKHEVKQVAIAQAVGMSPVYLNAILRGRRKAGADLQDAISRALGMSYDEVRVQGRGNVVLPALRVDATATYTPPAPNVEPAEMPKRGGMVPLISSVRAGLWTAAEGLEPGEAEEWVDAPAGVGARAFALRVVGDSMEPRFQEGEIIIVDPDIEAASGDYVVASLEREDATLKRYLREGGRDWLVPQNQRYDPIDMTGRDWKIIGRVMEKRQKF